MSPPKKFEFHLDHDRFLWKLKLTLGVLIFNSFITLLIIYIGYWLLGSEKILKIIEPYTAYHKIYISELNIDNILQVLRRYCMETAILEEYVYRYPIVCLLRNNLKIRIWRNLTNVSIIIFAIVLGLMWGYGHNNFYASIPITISGIPLYWLAFKTRRLWPCITCHAASNFLLYILAQFLIYQGVIERMVP